MSILRVSDALQFTTLSQRLTQLQLQIRTAQDQIGSGQRLSSPDEDPIGAAQVVRLDGNLAALSQYDQSTRFGQDVLKAQDDSLGQANDVLTRAQEIAVELGSGVVTPEQRNAAAEEVHGLLQHLTTLGNGDLAGRNLFAALSPNEGAPPFDDPDQVGYDPANAYHGPAQPFSINVGAGATQSVRLTTPGGQVFTAGLVALADLEDKLRTGGDVKTTIDPLEAARAGVDGERANVGAREAVLNGRTDEVKAQLVQQQGARSRIADTDLAVAITQLTQLQTALQAALAAGAQIAQTSLTSLLKL